MKYAFALSFFLICGGHIAAQSLQATDTVVVNMLNFSSSQSDSSSIEFKRNIERYFNRNLRAPRQENGFAQGYASVSFVVGTDGKVASPACPSMTNRSVGEEALRVTKKLSGTRIQPLTRNGEPVAAKVNVNICFTTDAIHSVSAAEIRSKAAIVVVAYN